MRLQLVQFSPTEDKIQTFTATLAENIHKITAWYLHKVGFKKKPDNLKSHYSSVPKIDLGANTTTDLWATFHFKTQGWEKLQVVTSGFLLVHSTHQLILPFHTGIVTFYSEAAKHMVKMYKPSLLFPQTPERETIWATTLYTVDYTLLARLMSKQCVVQAFQNMTKSI